MCTAFVRYGKDYICGFNMDINAEAMDWRLVMDEDRFESFYNEYHDLVAERNPD